MARQARRCVRARCRARRARARRRVRVRRRGHRRITATAVTRIGWVGLGRMGMPMCARLAEHGFVVRATDLRGDLREEMPHVGAEWDDTAADVAREAGVVITMLPGPEAVAEVADDLLRTLTPGSIWMDMSTGSPQLAEDLAPAAAARRVRLVDAPVAGGPGEARVGGLLSFVGGASADVHAVTEILESLADRILPVGPSGSGYLVKLLTNLLWFGQAIANAEALTLARRAGLDLNVLRDAVGQSAAANRFMAVDADALLDGDDKASFSLAGCCQQLTSVLRLGERLDVPLALATVVSDVHDRALARYGDVDGELLAATMVAEQAGVELRHRL